MENPRYFILYKPYGVLNQFTDEEDRPTLGDLYAFPKDVYAVGRLDLDSEGLLLLTNDTSINYRLLNPQFEHTKTYWVQVEGDISNEAIESLAKGMEIRINGKTFRTMPATAFVFDYAPDLPERDPPIRFRQHIPTSWISLTIMEGKKHQIRKMTAQVGFPTLRLVRSYIQALSLSDLGKVSVGAVKELSQEEVYSKLFG